MEWASPCLVEGEVEGKVGALWENEISLKEWVDGWLIE